jgi:hypothetical protein
LVKAAAGALSSPRVTWPTSPASRSAKAAIRVENKGRLGYGWLERDARPRGPADDFEIPRHSPVEPRPTRRTARQARQRRSTSDSGSSNAIRRGRRPRRIRARPAAAQFNDREVDMLTATARRATSVDDEDVEGRESVTGREGYLICQALGYAITAIKALPDEFQERSNARDMRQLLSYLTERAKTPRAAQARAARLIPKRGLAPRSPTSRGEPLCNFSFGGKNVATGKCFKPISKTRPPGLLASRSR